ncbi:MAG TPA: hypothetical protein VIO64_02750 [Pseudobacteroides sp.]|uniref:hypothetical protein n=1 Tax=Pseudobacteroides sp. TaxID=1968840 RepID=UPI002F959547
MDKELRTSAEMTDEELMDMFGGFEETPVVTEPIIVKPLYGIKPPIDVKPLYGIVVRPLYGIKPMYGIKPLYGIKPTE